MVAVIEAAASLLLNATFFRFDNLLSSCPVHLGLYLIRVCLFGDHQRIVVELVSIQVDGDCFDLPLPDRLWHQLNLGHIRLFLLHSERVIFCHF